MGKSTSGNMLGIVVAICLFLIILFLLPPMVGAARDLCNGRGYRNSTDGLCTCVTGYHGEGCEYSELICRCTGRDLSYHLPKCYILLEYCPFGKSWFSKPLQNNERNLALVPCSNMVHIHILIAGLYTGEEFDHFCFKLCATTGIMRPVPRTLCLPAWLRRQRVRTK